MGHHHGRLFEALGAGGAHIILVQIVQHRTAHVAADLRGGLQRQHHHRHDHLHELEFEAFPVVDHMQRVIDRRQPAQIDRKDHDQQRAGKERRDGKADHGDECAGLIEHGIVAVGGIDADGNGDGNTHHIGQPHHPERLGDALHNDVHHRAAGLP